MHNQIQSLRKSLGLSQSDFGARIGLSRDSIANIEGNRIEVKDVVVKMICREFNVSEEWLRTGEGDPHVPLSRSQVIADFSADILKDEEESFRRRLIEALAELDDDDWKVLEKIANSLQQKKD